MNARVAPYYRHDLALVHHRGFGFHAAVCAPGVLAHPEPVLARDGLVVEIGCGGGLTRANRSGCPTRNELGARGAGSPSERHGGIQAPPAYQTNASDTPLLMRRGTQTINQSNVALPAGVSTRSDEVGRRSSPSE